ncbi:MAG: methyltransferase domain-containing protein [Candidatus Riflebacteria bacterium]|nr:methyltransferase domain-containing protein [Candidatus Riflebacteria bacterium]
MEPKSLCIGCDTPGKKVNNIILFDVVNSSTYLCENCGLVWRSPLPSPQQIIDYYHHQYSRYSDRIQRKIASQQSTWLEENIKKLKLGNNFLFIEFGAGRGWLVKEMQNKAGIMKAVGIEPDEAAVNWGKESLGLSMDCGFVDSFNLPTEHYNSHQKIVAFSHVLEHLSDPLGALNKIKAGFHEHILFLEVPDGSLEGPVISLPESSLGEHFWSYTQKSLILFLEKNGYKILTSRTTGKKSYWQKYFMDQKFLAIQDEILKQIYSKKSIGKMEFFQYGKLFLSLLNNFLLTLGLKFFPPSRLDLPSIQILACYKNS